MAYTVCDILGMPGGNAPSIINEVAISFSLPPIGDLIGAAATFANDVLGVFNGEPHTYYEHTLVVDYIYEEGRSIHAIYSFSSSDDPACNHFAGIEANARVYYNGMPGESFSFTIG